MMWASMSTASSGDCCLPCEERTTSVIVFSVPVVLSTLWVASNFYLTHYLIAFAMSFNKKLFGKKLLFLALLFLIIKGKMEGGRGIFFW